MRIVRSLDNAVLDRVKADAVVAFLTRRPIKGFGFFRSPYSTGLSDSDPTPMASWNRV